MFKFCSLYSGSSGNSLFIENNNAKILIDAGESAKKIVEALTSIQVDVKDIDAILVTHEHKDHVKGLGTLSQKYNIPVYATQETWDAMPDQSTKVSDSNKNNFISYEDFSIKDLVISPFKIPHDAANPCGYNISFKKEKISIATDLGHITEDIFHRLEKSSFVLLESNYEPKMLDVSSYPYVLKQRIKGPKGHLSNQMAGKTISSLINTGLKTVMLGHLSKENNFPELAYKTVVEELIANNFDENSIKLGVASRHKPGPVIEIAS